MLYYISNRYLHTITVFLQEHFRIEVCVGYLIQMFLFSDYIYIYIYIYILFNVKYAVNRSRI